MMFMCVQKAERRAGFDRLDSRTRNEVIGTLTLTFGSLIGPITLLPMSELVTCAACAACAAGSVHATKSAIRAEATCGS